MTWRPLSCDLDTVSDILLFPSTPKSGCWGFYLPITLCHTHTLSSRMPGHMLCDGFLLSVLTTC